MPIGTFLLVYLFGFGTCIYASYVGRNIEARCLKVNIVLEIVLFLFPCRNKEKKVPYFALINQMVLQCGLIAYLIYVLGPDGNRTAHLFAVFLPFLSPFISGVGFIREQDRYRKKLGDEEYYRRRRERRGEGEYSKDNQQKKKNDKGPRL